MQFKVGNPNLNKVTSPKEVQKKVRIRRKFPEDYSINTQSLAGEDRDKFIISYMGLVEYIAYSIIRDKPASVELKDLVQVGVLGLLDAMDRYSTNKKILFSTFAKPRIRGAILDSLRKGDHFPRHTRKKVAIVSTALKKNEDRTNRGLEPLTDEEIARNLGIDIRKYRHYQRLIPSSRPLVRLDEFLENEESGDITDLNAEPPDKSAHKEEIRRIVESALEEFFLSVQSKMNVGRLRDLYNKYYVEERFMGDIAKDYDMTEGRISQLLMIIKNGVKGVLKNRGVRASDVSRLD